ncbi:NAD(P)H-binding protein [Poritiphilus flavus]|uniref:NAD(P)H-binding protein n=1 Tax=Poritiphilus flavus TaxID=2697053 RepID=A0A6L9EA95_9FLAO|nr:NAD(P)H-binding protein [Poritiphilus flavus]NAS11502.1 NAD(P)H-binding protein [Poritiphilus flavus]
MKNALITGATGMIGSIVLDHCLKSEEIASVTSIVRRKSGVEHPKLKEIIHEDFTDYTSIRDHFRDIDVAFYCIGVYTGAVPDDIFRKITVDYTVVFTDALKAESPGVTLCFLSGAGADLSEKSRTSFARYKGMAENHLLQSGLNFFSFRPAYIYPVEKRKEPNLMYRISRRLYPLIRLFGNNASIRSTELGHAMFLAGINGATSTFLENRDILELLK